MGGQAFALRMGRASMPEPMPPPWQPDPGFPNANRAEHAIIEGFELIAYELPAAPSVSPRVIGWELFTGPDLHTLVDQGGAETFDAAKAAAEEALRSRQAPTEQG